MTIFYFTSTGNCMHVVRSIGGRTLSIPQELVSEQREYKDDSIGFCFPCFYWDTPQIVKQFLRQKKFSAQYFFAITTCGTTAMACTNNFFNLCKRLGIRLDYINRLVMVDNYLPLFDIEKQKLCEPKKQIETHLVQIVGDIFQRKHYIHKIGLLPYLLSNLCTKIEYALCHNKDNHYRLNSNCVACGYCVKICPVNNIKLKKGKPHFLHHCQDCLACIHICPKNALHVRGERSSARYINPNINIKDLLPM
jgi:Uncharacterized Fe-S center protein